MSEKVVSKNRKIVYVSLLIVAVLAIGVICALAITMEPKNTVGGQNSTPIVDSGTQNQNSTPNSNDQGNVEEPNENVDQKPNEDDNQKPVVEVITFLNPVSGGAVMKSYTDSTVVFSNTLGIYTGHLGIDFTGVEGANVIAVYKGVVKEIYTSYLQGTTIKIEHGNGLVTVYNSVEALEGLSVGQTVKQGDVIAYVSDNNKQEYKDGPHLHFEVYENGSKISPYKYLAVSDK